MADKIVLRRNLALHSPPEKLWPWISDTARINRACRLPPVTYSPSPDSRVFRRAKARALGPINLYWDEPPFEWVEPQFHRVERKFHGGPIREIITGVRLEPHEGGSRVELFTEMIPHFALGWIAKIRISKGMLDFAELCERFDRAASGALDQPFERKGGISGIHEARISRLAGQLAGKVDAAALAALCRHLSSAYDAELVRMRPFELADRWKLPRMEVLKAFLWAARVGLLDLHWVILCPVCRVSKAEHGRLGDLKSKAQCEVCGELFDSEFDRNVEARFTVNASIRNAVDEIFCIGGPGNTPHRRAQLMLLDDGERTVDIDLPAQPLFVRPLGGEGRVALVPDASAAGELRLTFKNSRLQDDEFRFRPGRVRLALAHEGRGREPVWATVDEEAWTDKAATAAFVTTLQDFRDLFASDALSPGEQISVKNIAILFTDIKGSTALYERVGDAKAYGLVRDHFEILMGAVRACKGGIVKTIGDAIMAAFVSADDAAEAACLIQERFADYNRHRPAGKEEIVVKVGAHLGPAIVVNNRDMIDYFGTTVNVAARVQSESAGGDIVLSQAMMNAAGAVIEKHGCRTERFDITLKGLSGRFTLWRAWLGEAKGERQAVVASGNGQSV